MIMSSVFIEYMRTWTETIELVDEDEKKFHNLANEAN